MNSNSYFNAFILVFLAGLFWSFGAVTVRYMIDGHTYVFQYLFYRGISIAIILLIYLFLKEGKVFIKIFFVLEFHQFWEVFFSNCVYWFYFFNYHDNSSSNFIHVGCHAIYCSYCWLFYTW